MRTAILILFLSVPAYSGAKDIKEFPLGDSASMVLQSEEAGQKSTYTLQLRREGRAPVQFWSKEMEKVPGRIEEWVKMVDGIEVDGRVTVLVQTYIASFVLLQGGENGQVENEVWLHSSALEAAENLGGGSIKLKSPTEVVITSVAHPAPVTATITPKGELLVDGKPMVRKNGGTLTVGGGAARADGASAGGAATGAAAQGKAPTAAGQKGAQSQSQSPATAPAVSGPSYTRWGIGAAVALLGLGVLLWLVKKQG